MKKKNDSNIIKYDTFTSMRALTQTMQTENIKVNTVAKKKKKTRNNMLYHCELLNIFLFSYWK